MMDVNIKEVWIRAIKFFCFYFKKGDMFVNGTCLLFKIVAWFLKPNVLVLVVHLIP